MGKIIHAGRLPPGRTRVSCARRGVGLLAICLWVSARLSAADPGEVTCNGIVFVPIPAGSFTMGTSDQGKKLSSEQKNWSCLLKCERPARTVTITKPLLIGKTEVTQKQWKDVMNGKNPSAFKGDNLPVESVGWKDVQTFIRELNKKGGGKFPPAHRGGVGVLPPRGRDQRVRPGQGQRAHHE